MLYEVELVQQKHNYANDCALLSLVREQPVLYDSSIPDYKNVRTRGEIWKAIGRALERTDMECKTRYKTLRDNYIRRRKTPRKLEDWEYTREFAFLEGFIDPLHGLRIRKKPRLNETLDSSNLPVPEATYEDVEAEGPVQVVFKTRQIAVTHPHTEDQEEVQEVEPAYSYSKQENDSVCIELREPETTSWVRNTQKDVLSCAISNAVGHDHCGGECTENCGEDATESGTSENATTDALLEYMGKVLRSLPHKLRMQAKTELFRVLVDFEKQLHSN